MSDNYDITANRIAQNVAGATGDDVTAAVWKQIAEEALGSSTAQQSTEK